MMFLKNRDAASRVFRIRVKASDHDSADPRLDDRIRARRRTSPGRTGFQSYINRCAFQVSACRAADRVDFRMPLSGAHMPALSENPAVFHDDGADHGVRARRPESLFRQTERFFHPFDIIIHFNTYFFLGSSVYMACVIAQALSIFIFWNSYFAPHVSENTIMESLSL